MFSMFSVILIAFIILVTVLYTDTNKNIPSTYLNVALCINIFSMGNVHISDTWRSHPY